MCTNSLNHTKQGRLDFKEATKYKVCSWSAIAIEQANAEGNYTEVYPCMHGACLVHVSFSPATFYSTEYHIACTCTIIATRMQC